ncbi:MAG TPA: DNA polymerase III subunit delta' [Paracoccaceae bacterium]|nr:DNA polymerase III subunit delta' [Paracoccaceae bacterium]
MARAPKTDAPPLPEPDRQDGAPHPRDTGRLFGQAAAEAAFLDAFAGGRLHHAWLIAGPRGIGKATLAWRIARFLLTTPDPGAGGLFDAPPAPSTLDTDPGHPAVRRILALSEPRLHLLRRGPTDKGDRLAQVITVDETRRLRGFLSLSAADGGRRVVILDSADEMNTSAANAILKLLEEPPAHVTFLIVAHQPARLLPTIRSRCRVLRLAPLSPPDLAEALALAGAPAGDPAALAELAGGSVGAALALSAQDGAGLYRDLVALLATLPRLDRPRAIALADSAGARGAEGRFDLAVTLIDRALARLARTGATGRPPPEAAPGEAAVLARLSPDIAAGRAWADLAQALGVRARAGRAVNLDPSALLMDILLRLDDTAARLAQR